MELGRAGGGEMPVIDWDSPQMHEIEAEWISLLEAYQHAPLGRPTDRPLRYRKYVKSVDQLFRRRMSLRRLRGLAASSKVPARTDQ